MEPIAQSGPPTVREKFEKFRSEKDRVGIYSPIELIPGFEALVAIPFQKILIVNKSSSLLAGNEPNKEITLQFEPTENAPGPPKPIVLSVRVIRVCEYHNPDNEYDVPTNTILVEWDAVNKIESKPNAPFGTFVDGQAGIIASGQIENLILQDPPNNKPGPPPLKELPQTDGSSVDDSDFDINPPEGTPAAPTDPIVAVLDTGIKTNFEDQKGAITNQYPDSSSQMRLFKLAKAPAGIQHQYGYTPVTDYLRASNGDSEINKTKLTILQKLSKDQILNSPYDDHRVIKGDNRLGRHGTTISAIITQKSEAAILPVKIFNNGGQGTLYDLLCGLNYVLACHKAGLPIQVINLSFAGQLHYAAYNLLLSKFRALHKADIWAVAAAGNRLDTNNMSSRRELKIDVVNANFDPSAKTNAQEVWNLFPACFAGNPTLSVITVTTVEKSTDPNPKKPNQFWSLILALLRLLFSLFGSSKTPVDASVYEAVNNYSKSFVSVGVIESLTKVFQNASPDLNATSFAVAFFSAKLADYLKKHPQADRNKILRALAINGKMKSNNEIADNWLIHYR